MCLFYKNFSKVSERTILTLLLNLLSEFLHLLN